MHIKNRAISGEKQRDPSSVGAIEYNEPSGGQKNLPVGPHLLPLGDGAGGYTTDASVQKALPKPGCNLAIFNKSNGTNYSITIGDSSVLAQAIGGIQAGTQFVGIACPHGSWTYVSSTVETHVITNSNELVVYVIDDHTYIVSQPD